MARASSFPAGQVAMRSGLFSCPPPANWWRRISSKWGYRQAHCFTNTLWDRNWKLIKFLFCSNFTNNDPIRSQFCTCHDSWAVVRYAKLWPNWIITLHAIQILWHLDYELNSLIETAPDIRTKKSLLGNSSTHARDRNFSSKLSKNILILIKSISLSNFCFTP